MPQCILLYCSYTDMKLYELATYKILLIPVHCDVKMDLLSFWGAGLTVVHATGGLGSLCPRALFGVCDPVWRGR